MMNINDPQHENFSEESLLLDSLRKPPPMAAPEGYFQSFGDRLKERIEEEELQAAAPTLFGMARITPFKTPEGYFGQLPKAILKKLNGEQPSAGTIRPMFLSLYATAAAAVIILLVMWKGSTEIVQPFPELPELSADELLAVVDIEEDLIIESLIPEDLEVLTSEIPIPVSVPPEEPVVEELPPVADELSFDELLDGLEELDDAELDALEAELMDLEGEEWYD